MSMIICSIHQTAKKFPKNTAVINDSHCISYQELESIIESFRNNLIQPFNLCSWDISIII